jgi:hypothetical protein
MSALVLTPPTKGKPLILYIVTTNQSLGAFLAQEDLARKERAIHYISRTLNDYEINYTSIENDFLAVVFTSQ